MPFELDLPEIHPGIVEFPVWHTRGGTSTGLILAYETLAEDPALDGCASEWRPAGQLASATGSFWPLSVLREVQQKIMLRCWGW